MKDLLWARPAAHHLMKPRFLLLLLHPGKRLLWSGRRMIRLYGGVVLLVAACVSCILVGDLLLTRGYSKTRSYIIHHLTWPMGHTTHTDTPYPPLRNKQGVFIGKAEELGWTLVSRIKEFSYERENLTVLLCSNAEYADQECYNPQCPATFSPSPKSRLRQVLATRSLVPVTYQRAMTSATRFVTSHKYVFVTAASSNHYYELQAMLGDAQVNLFPQLGDDNYTLVIYDLGLTPFERYATERNCNCTVLDFPFDDLPYFVRHLTCYAWKPIAINSLVSKASEYLVWMDTSIRWSPLTVKEVFERAKARGHQCVPDHGSIAVRTVQSMFHFYKDQPCQYEPFAEILATVHVFYVERFSKEVLLAPWLSCALDQQCMCGVDFMDHLNCGYSGEPPRKLGRCHRFDQSSLGIILSKLLLDHRPVFYMPEGAVKIVKQASADWFQPSKKAAVLVVVIVYIIIDVLLLVVINKRKRSHHRLVQHSDTFICPRTKNMPVLDVILLQVICLPVCLWLSI